MYKKRNSELLRHLDFELIDLICMFAVMFIIAYMRHYLFLEGHFSVYMRRFILQVLLDVIIILFLHPYKDIIQRGYWSEFQAIFKHFSILFITLIVTQYLAHDATSLPRLSITLEWIFGMTLAFIFHCLLKNSLRKKLSNNEQLSRMLVISDSGHFKGTLSEFALKKYPSYQICALYLTDRTEILDFDPGQSCRILHSQEECKEYLRKDVVDEVFLDYCQDSNEIKELVDILLDMGIVVHVSISEFEIDFPHKTLNHFGNRYAITTMINEAPEWQLTVKRVIDICGSLVGLLITGIASIFIVPAIKLADPGPVIFSQDRVGKNGRVFRFYKFRSMYIDAEEQKEKLMDQNEMQGLMFKMENDPRVIGSEKGPGKGLGNFLRKTSLDELPQFWNILKGDMSLIGTRPPTVGEYEQYEMRHKIRLSMNPGLTGLWQVSGRNDITDFEEVVRLDTEYIENWTLGQDIKILFKTIGVVLGKVGSK